MGEYINSKTARFDRSLVSCGVVECHHLPEGNPSKTVFAIANHLYHKANPRPAAYVIFSDTVDNKRGAALADFILNKMEKGKGLLWSSPAQINPRTGNTITLWVWTLDHDVLRKWYAEEAMHRVSE